MTTFLFLLLVWAFITALGHGSWLAVRATIAFVFPPHESETDSIGAGKPQRDFRRQDWQRSPATGRVTRDPEPVPSPLADIAAFERMVDALSATQEIAPHTAEELKQKAQSFANTPVSDPGPREQWVDTDEQIELNETSELPPEIVSEHRRDENPESEPRQAPRVDPVSESISVAAVRPAKSRWQAPAPSPPPPASAKRALSDVIASFLAAHNIRWGELVAGLLIVICSIGLVVSLWSTLTSSHRVMPSLIFMSADAAIFAAGLYTMRRWKLRHTSRAVLIIATLLVPLCVLAGLAAAGASVESVSLGSPVTLAAIAVGTLVCGWLLWQASVVLVGRGRALALTLSVVVPTLCLPLLPAVARMLGSYAGSFLLIPAIATAIGLVLPVRRHLRFVDGTPESMIRIGRRYWTNHWLHVGIAVASLASVIVYAAFLYQADGRTAWIQIAIATIPAWVSIGMVHAGQVTVLSGQAKWATSRFVCSVLAVIAVGAVFAVLPASIEQVRWLWTHALVISGSLVLVSGLLRGRARVVASSLPIGVAAMLSSPLWLAGADWNDVAVWHRFLGGEPLLIATGLAVVGALIRAISQRVGWRAESGALTFVTVFWAGVASAQAIVLSVSPLSWLGMMPVWALACVLVGIMLLCAAFSLRKPIAAWGATIASASFWIIAFGLVKWYGRVLTLDYDSAGLGLLGVAATTLGLGVGVKAVGSRKMEAARVRASVSQFTESSAASSCAAVGLLAVLASIGRHVEGIAAPTWGVAAWTIAAASVLLAGAGVLAHNRRYLQLGMLVSIASVFCGVTKVVGTEIWQLPAWKSADALWYVAGVLAATAIVWQVVREGDRWVRLHHSGVSPADDGGSRWRLPDGGMLLGSVACLVVAVLWQYLAVLFAPLGSPLDEWFVLESPADIPAVGKFVLLGCLSAGLAWCRYREPGRLFSQMLSIIGTISGLLLALTLSHRFTELASARLITTTTLACVGIQAAWWINHRLHRNPVGQAANAIDERSLGAGTIGVLIAAASMVLLRTYWWLPLSTSAMPDRLSTLAVAMWWVAVSIGLLLHRGWRSGQESEASDGVDAAISPRFLSALLLPAAVGISVPALYQSAAILWWQTSALGSVVWLIMAWLYSRCYPAMSDTPSDGQPSSMRNIGDQGVGLSHLWISVVGLGSAAMVLLGLVSAASWTASWSLPVGAVTSLLAIRSVFLSLNTSDQSIDSGLILRMLPFVPAVMSGHAAVVAVAMGWIAPNDMVFVVMGCGLLSSLGSAILVWLRSERVQAWHVSFQAIVLFVFTVLAWQNRFNLTSHDEGWVAWVSLAGLAIGAVALMRFLPANFNELGWQPIRILPRVLGWLIVIAGAVLLVDHPHFPSSPSPLTLTLMTVWVGASVVLWRSDRLTSRGHSSGPRADIGASVLLLPMLLAGIIELLETIGGPSSGRLTNAVMMGLAQAAIAFAVAASAWLRPAVKPGRVLSMWTVSMSLMSGASALGALSLTKMAGAPTDSSWVMMVLAAMGALSISVGLMPWLEKGRAKLAHRVGGDGEADRLGVAAGRVVLAWVVIGSMVSFGLTAAGSDANWIRLSILGSAIAAWTLFQLSEQTRPTDSPAANRRRHRCITLGLWTLALFAMLGEPQAMPYLLTATMRLLIASVLAIAVLVLAVPLLLAGPFLERWQHAFRRGGMLSAIVGLGSLLVMLGLEVQYRQGDAGIPQIALPLVVIVAIIMGTFALMAGVIAVLSGPGFSHKRGEQGESPEDSHAKNWLRIDDTRRRGLLYVAQGIAGLTWLHLFLCRSGIAFAGLRPYWPYIVMLIAFASVGLTQWARRRKDIVLSETMEKTAMFLPLIPVVGFWLSGSFAMMVHSQDWSWTFYSGSASYAGLLVVGAIYYGVMSVLWKRGFPRVATVVLANGALWVMLTQIPGWGFLTHPQAWLIPPAMGVLGVAHWQRHLLDQSLGSAIRYAATLVIYISSTADMLMSEIGSSLWGPIILIVLSLAGMLVGVVLRIKPFLYLGTIFVFLGVTSMVWHAGQAIDAVWPWWVFGITSGLILLSVLAGLEKHRDKLQRWSDELSRWES